MMSYIILRGRWFDIIVLDVHVQTDGKIDDVKLQVVRRIRTHIR
jgi:hypothetical protein